MKPEQLVSAAFSFFMALFFLYSFLFPQQTGFWIASAGLTLLILESLSFAALLMIAQMMGKETGWIVGGGNRERWRPVRKADGSFAMEKDNSPSGIEYAKKNKSNPVFSLLIISLMALATCYATANLELFGYFVLTLGVKAYSSRTRSDMKEEGKAIAIGVVFLVVSVFLGMFFSAPDALFGQQNAAYREYFKGMHTSGSLVDNPVTLAGWGFCYFVLSGIQALVPLQVVIARKLGLRPAKPEDIQKAMKGKTGGD
jgi:hypothetical protein